MKSLKMIAIVALTMFGTAALAQSKTEKIKVLGNCGMCKKRIEASLKDEAITNADWDKNSKILTVTYNSNKINSQTIQQKIANAGHDTPQVKAKNEIYDKLPGCCQYDRTGKPSKAH
ncbi:heavy-metal-associated domain-containing protein [Sphingobacterium spiritivorum]|nr:heavy-metal-associated domain-containing protein [Sphingobacterium spiritivorum]QQT36316.1 cation transporter [Sphingobacterium spiritivorum]WQD33056.1 heavy-metal-associated domain-containing protein [Sphingobacterium spiritivorum]